MVALIRTEKVWERMRKQMLRQVPLSDRRNLSEANYMIIDHIGITVRSLEAGIAHWEKTFGYRQMTEIIENTRQKVRVVFLSKEDSLPVKLIEPKDDSSTIAGLAKKGGGLHHICFRCEDLEAGVRKLKELGLRILVEPQAGEAFENEKIAFIYDGHGLNIELIDTEKRAGRLGIAAFKDGERMGED